MNEKETLEFVKKYTEDLLAFFEVNVDVDVQVSDGIVEISVPSSEVNSLLIGRGAETLRSIQYLISTTLRNNNGSVERVNLDIADYKKQRAEQLAEKARGWIAGVRETGDSYVAHLNAADRRVVHQVATEFEDIQTFSEGEGRDRRLIIAQKSS
jgi:spoIIIJ-associated protein